MANSTPPASAARALWKGAISFGLVHIPVGLYSATASSDIDFDWIDRRSMEPVGYQRINKATGKKVEAKDIVKGVAIGDGRYVVLSPEEIAAAFPKTTQTIEIESFVDADDIPFVYLERPYYTAPLPRGEKVYALLREALHQSGKAALGKVVIQTRQHLAVLIPCGRALVLNLLRWGGEIRSFEPLALPPAGAQAVGIRDAEMKMALQLIEDMAQPWNADQFRNSFAEQIQQLVQAKAEAGEATAVGQVTPAEDAVVAPAGANVLDLAALLQRSLTGQKKPVAGARPATVTALPGARAAAKKSKAAPVQAASKTAAKASVKAPAKAPAKKAPRRAAASPKTAAKKPAMPRATAAKPGRRAA